MRIESPRVPDLRLIGNQRQRGPYITDEPGLDGLSEAHQNDSGQTKQTSYRQDGPDSEMLTQRLRCRLKVQRNNRLYRHGMSIHRVGLEFPLPYGIDGGPRESE